MVNKDIESSNKTMMSDLTIIEWLKWETQILNKRL